MRNLLFWFLSFVGRGLPRPRDAAHRVIAFRVLHPACPECNGEGSALRFTS